MLCQCEVSDMLCEVNDIYLFYLFIYLFIHTAAQLYALWQEWENTKMQGNKMQQNVQSEHYKKLKSQMKYQTRKELLTTG